ncbi:MAG: histidine--tRNA ligase [Deltaproteobacteria bacterium]|nr:histidine--tRNA ligase [Deltaproteobacteria bacterium]MBI4796366.1 histidine--tRNA ligase [Deltaproteobacteria bacterium]
MAGKIKAIRGMRDILPPETGRWQAVESAAREAFALYGYRELRLPLIERTELFARSIGQDTDIVAKEMYTFPDRHGESLTLRPEATASVLRAVLENGLDKGGGVKKFYTLGPMFRYERPQKGRYRQFYQINCEALGSDAPEVDAEVILLLMEILKRVQLGASRLLVNSLGCPECQVKFKAGLGLFLINKEGLCEDCQRRRNSNPLRVLDCKSIHCREILKDAPVLRDYLCPDCAGHFTRVLALLSRFGVTYEEQPRLVRGLDYYTRTAFEVVAVGLGAQDAVAGGGRYNGLAKELGGPDLPAIGFAIGEDRLLEVLPENLGQGDGKKVFLAALGPGARDKAFSLLQTLRQEGIAAEMDFGERSLKAQMSQADRLGAAYTVILGERELETGQVVLRRMATGDQQQVALSLLPMVLAGL